VPERPDDDIALFVAMPDRHLQSASALDRDVVDLPLGRPGDVPRASRGCAVYLVALDDDGVADRAATWRASFVTWTDPGTDQGASLPGLPPSWIEERAAEDVADEPAPGEEPQAGADEDENDDEEDRDDEDGERPRQVFISVEGLAPLERRDWIFTNEVVPKQRRGSRTFVPMTPTLVRLPD
jgi:hypothetical protein